MCGIWWSTSKFSVFDWVKQNYDHINFNCQLKIALWTHTFVSFCNALTTLAIQSADMMLLCRLLPVHLPMIHKPSTVGSWWMLQVQRQGISQGSLGYICLWSQENAVCLYWAVQALQTNIKCHWLLTLLDVTYGLKVALTYVECPHQRQVLEINISIWATAHLPLP